MNVHSHVYHMLLSGSRQYQNPLLTVVHRSPRYNPISSRLCYSVKYGVLCKHGLKNDCYLISPGALFYCISNDRERDAVVVGAG